MLWADGSEKSSALNVSVVVVVSAHLQQEAQRQGGRKTHQTQIQPLQQTAAQLTHCKFLSLPSFKITLFVVQVSVEDV